jgi:integrase/recombinase XerD
MIDKSDVETLGVRWTCVGPLGPHINGFAAFLLREGYACRTVQEKCYLVMELNRWAQRRRLPLTKLDEEQLTRFRVSSDHHRRVRRGDTCTAHQLLQYLRDLDCIPLPQEKVDKSSLGRFTRDFERYLTSERGLSPSTIREYLYYVRLFLIDRFGDKPLRVKALRSSDIHQFIVAHLKVGSRCQAKAIVSALRPFLRFLHQRGAITIDLAAMVPGVADWRLSHLPRSLPPKQVKQLLASCGRSPLGRRNYAILLLIARLGLRANEVVRMTLDDLDWDCGEIVVRGKDQKAECMPLPSDVGEALVKYLRDVRPACSSRRVFLRMKGPRTGLKGSEAVGAIVRTALKRAGLNPEVKGPHLLRHSLATNLLRRGATLTEISQILRHNNVTTTQIYAKVDIAALRAIALPWPRGAL